MKRAITKLIAAVFLLGSASLMAQSITVGSDAGIRGGVVVIPVNFTQGATPVGSFDLDVTFTSAKFSAASGNCTVAAIGQFAANCSGNAGLGQLRISIVGTGTSQLTTGLVANLSFTIAAGAAFGPETLDGVMFSVGDVGGNDVSTNTIAVTDGTLTVNGPTYSSNPAAGSLNVGSVQQNNPDISTNVVISNTGAASTTLTGTCSETADPDNVFSLSGDTGFSVPQAGPADTVTVTCDSAGSINTHTGTMSCTHNGTNTSPQTYNLSCEITAGPQPSFSSNPAPGQINLGSVPQGSAAPTQNISISNSGSTGTTLTGTCSLGAGDAQITLTSDGAFSVLQGGAADIQTVSCSTAAEGTYNRTLTCPHNGSNGPSASFPVQCIIGPPPAPEYSSNPAIGQTLDFGGSATEQGDPDPTDSISINNSGEANSELDVTCTDSSDPGNVFTVTNGTINNLLPTGGNRTVTVTCDSATQGNYTGTLSCDHNGETATDPATYPLSCLIGPPGAAIFSSDPVKDSTIDLTDGTAVLVGTNVATKPLSLMNIADPGDSDLQIICIFGGGSDAEITVAPAVSGDYIAPGGSKGVAFDCDTSKSGSYSASYECFYDLQVAETLVAGDTPQAIDNDGEANYTVTCDVRDPETVVQPSPADGTTLANIVQPGGTVNFGVTFFETADEDVDPNDAILAFCEINGTDAGRFTILSPSFPQFIASGGSVQVQVQGSDDGSKQVYNANLVCAYGDTDDECQVEDDLEGVAGIPESCQVAEYPLVMTVGGDASFNVTKEFSDGDNPTEVEVTISCNTGLPIIQSQQISETRDVTFIVQSFDTGEMNCTITENTGVAELDGYTPTYTADGTGESDDGSGGCVFTAIDGGDEFTCHIVNDADPVEVDIEKLWVIEGDGGDAVDQHYKLTLYCDAEISDGDKYCHGKGGYGEGPFSQNGQYESCKKFEGYTSETFTAWVTPEWPSSHCWVDEKVYDDSVEIQNDCGDLTISHGQGDSCLITNTVFFEGIPTLSQYGLAILALLMLGVGLVGFRRFV